MKADYTTAIFSACGLPAPVAEHRFHPTRRWRFDLAWPEQMVALEIEGGVWTGGRHTRGAGYLKDIEKYSVASAMGWCVIRTCPQNLHSSNTRKLLAHALTARTSRATDAETKEIIHAVRDVRLA